MAATRSGPRCRWSRLRLIRHRHCTGLGSRILSSRPPPPQVSSEPRVAVTAPETSCGSVTFPRRFWRTRRAAAAARPVPSALRWPRATGRRSPHPMSSSLSVGCRGPWPKVTSCRPAPAGVAAVVSSPCRAPSRPSLRAVMRFRRSQARDHVVERASVTTDGAKAVRSAGCYPEGLAGHKPHSVNADEKLDLAVDHSQDLGLCGVQVTRNTAAAAHDRLDLSAVTRRRREPNGDPERDIPCHIDRAGAASWDLADHDQARATGRSGPAPGGDDHSRARR